MTDEDGVNATDPVLIGQSPVAEQQRQVVKTKTLGQTTKESKSKDTRKVSEAKALETAQAKTEQQADKVRDEVLSRAGEKRHLRYEVIEDADIVQISVINSEDGTIVRKVPSDKVVGLVKKIRERRKQKLDMKI